MRTWRQLLGVVFGALGLVLTLAPSAGASGPTVTLSLSNAQQIEMIGIAWSGYDGQSACYNQSTMYWIDFVNGKVTDYDGTTRNGLFVNGGIELGDPCAGTTTTYSAYGRWFPMDGAMNVNLGRGLARLMGTVVMDRYENGDADNATPVAVRFDVTLNANGPLSFQHGVTSDRIAGVYAETISTLSRSRNAAWPTGSIDAGSELALSLPLTADFVDGGETMSIVQKETHTITWE